jgi:hypothetical protein
MRELADMAGGLTPLNVQVTPDGKLGIVNNIRDAAAVRDTARRLCATSTPVARTPSPVGG